MFAIENGNRSGHTVVNGKGDLAFLSYHPTLLKDVTVEYTDSLVSKIGRAHDALTRLNTVYEHMSEEAGKAFTDSQLEKETEDSLRLSVDTSTPMPEYNAEESSGGIDILNVFNMQMTAQKVRPDLSDDDKLDLEYLRKSCRHGFDRMNDLPISRRLIMEVQDFLMQAPRNYDSKPGELRYSPVWMGSKNTGLKDAQYVPPVPDTMLEGLNDLELFINYREEMDPLVKSALIHYQFEMLHPFVDGNGRTGRLLNMMYLQESGALAAPILTMSSTMLDLEFRYYTGIMSVELNGIYENWINTWLDMIIDAAERDEKQARLALAE